MSIRNFWNFPSGTSIARPAILASPLQEVGSSVGVSSLPLWKATRASRCRSPNFTDAATIPKKTSPSEKSISMPLMRGDPSRLMVAIVLCFCASNTARTFCAKSGSAASTSAQDDIELYSVARKVSRQVGE